MTESTAGLDVRGLTLTLPLFTLYATFSVTPGERLGLTGRSGVGKTTLFRAIAGLRSLETRDTGTIHLGGRDVTTMRAHQRQIGYLFQNPPLLDHLNVLENVALALRIKGVGKMEREGAAREWLRKVHLEGRAGDAVGVLSGGERQRVAFAQTLLAKPRLLLLDEPFSALDRDLRIELRELLLRLATEAQIPVILVSHHADDIAAFATRSLSIQERDGGRTRIIEA